MTDLSTIQVLALVGLAVATVERGGDPVGADERREFIYRALVARGLAEVYSPRRAALEAGFFSLADDAGPDVYRITFDGGKLAQAILANAG